MGGIFKSCVLDVILLGISSNYSYSANNYFSNNGIEIMLFLCCSNITVPNWLGTANFP